MLVPLGLAMLGLYGDKEDEVYFGVTAGDAVMGESLAETVCGLMSVAQVECASRVSYEILERLDGDASWAPILAMLLIIGGGGFLDEGQVWDNVVEWVSVEPRSLFHVIMECVNGGSSQLLKEWLVERMGQDPLWRKAAEIIIDRMRG